MRDSPLKQTPVRGADGPAAVFVVCRSPPEGIGILSAVASGVGFRWFRPRHGDNNGRNYPAAPDHHLLLFESHIMLGRGPRENMPRQAIDGDVSKRRAAHNANFERGVDCGNPDGGVAGYGLFRLIPARGGPVSP